VYLLRQQPFASLQYQCIALLSIRKTAKVAAANWGIVPIVYLKI